MWYTDIRPHSWRNFVLIQNLIIILLSVNKSSSSPCTYIVMHACTYCVACLYILWCMLMHACTYCVACLYILWCMLMHACTHCVACLYILWCMLMHACTHCDACLYIYCDACLYILWCMLVHIVMHADACLYILCCMLVHIVMHADACLYTLCCMLVHIVMHADACLYILWCMLVHIVMHADACLYTLWCMLVHILWCMVVHIVMHACTYCESCLHCERVDWPLPACLPCKPWRLLVHWCCRPGTGRSSPQTHVTSEHPWTIPSTGLSHSKTKESQHNNFGGLHHHNYPNHFCHACNGRHMHVIVNPNAMVPWPCAKSAWTFENFDLLAHIQWCVSLAHFYCKCLLQLLNNLLKETSYSVAESRQPVLWLWISAERLKMSMHRIHMHFNYCIIPHSSISSSWPCIAPSC